MGSVVDGAVETAVEGEEEWKEIDVSPLEGKSRERKAEEVVEVPEVWVEKRA